MQMNYVRCFTTDKLNSGNPAAIVEGFTNDKVARQQLATANSLPVTAFIDHHNGLYELSYFYPACEMPLCMHGTLAAASQLFKKQHTAKLQVKTAAGQTLTLLKSKPDFYEIAVNLGKVLPNAVSEREILTMLNIAADAIDHSLPCCIASIGSPKLLIPLRSLAILGALQPNFAEIRAWSIANNVNGLYVYCQEAFGNADFHARGFNPKGGIDEDAATGVAAGALLTALGSREMVLVEQGHFIERPSLISVRQDGEAVYIGGKVLTTDKPE